MIVALVIFIILTILFFYTTYNLLKKSEKLEKLTEKQQEWILGISQIVDHSSERLKEIDDRGMFSADDEIGWFFNSLKELQELINEYVKESK
jgi:cell division protein FtsL